ncbi:MAG: preprotein translocase subunit SecG [Kiritimatiellae bacterium]|nr:preprotein translocase subunit SecG [Kiritimatiellia bacterium]
MAILINCLYVFEVIVCLLLGGVVMLQKPKDGGLNVAMGGGMGESMFGAQMGNVLTKTTVVLGCIFLLNTLVLSRLTSHRSSSVMEGVRSAAPAAPAAPVQLPSVPASDAAPAPAPAPSAAPTTAPATAPAAAPATAPAATPSAPAAPATPAP